MATMLRFDWAQLSRPKSSYFPTAPNLDSYLIPNAAIEQAATPGVVIWNHVAANAYPLFVSAIPVNGTIAIAVSNSSPRPPSQANDLALNDQNSRARYPASDLADLQVSGMTIQQLAAEARRHIGGDTRHMLDI